MSDTFDPTKGHWEYCPFFWARSAGFPLERALRLAFAQTPSALREAIDAEARRLELAQELRALLAAHGRIPPKPAPMPKHDLKKVGAMIDGGQLLPETTQDLFDPSHAGGWLETVGRYNEQARRQAAAVAAARDHFPSELERSRKALREAFDEKMFEALWISSRSLSGNLEQHFASPLGTRNTKARQFERSAMTVVQRMTSKNETISFFGPYFWGRMDPSSPSSIRYSPSKEGGLVSRSMASFEHWAVSRLCKAMVERELWLELRPIFNPSCHRAGRTVIYPIGKRLELDDHSKVVAELCDGARTAREVIAAAATSGAFAGQPLDRLQALYDKSPDRKPASRPWATVDDAAENFFNDLRERRIIICEMSVPTVIPNPEQELRRRLEALPASAPRDLWLEHVQAFCGWVESYQRAPYRERRELMKKIDEKFTALTGNEANRGAGKMYSARTVVYEDCLRNVEELVFGGRLLRDLDSLHPYFEIARWLTLEIPRRYQQRYLEAFYRLTEGGQPTVDLQLFLNETRAIAESTDIEDGLRDEVLNAWTEVLGDRYSASSEELQIHKGDFERVLELLQQGASVEETPPFQGSFYQAPDFLVAATSVDAINRGEYQLVLGEMHKCLFLAVQPASQPFCPYKDQLYAYTASVMPENIYQLVDRPEKGTRSDQQWPNVPPFHEVTIDGATSRFPEERKVPFGSFEVVERAGNLFARTRDGRHETWFFSALVSPSFLTKPEAVEPIALPGARTPRVRLDDRVIIQRRKWRFERDELPDLSAVKPESTELWLTLLRWKNANAIPDLCFIKVPNEPKPVFIDFRNYLSVELFLKQAYEAPAVSVSEMLPAPDQVWLSDAQGQTYTSEFRTTVVYRNDSSPGSQP